MKKTIAMLTAFVMVMLSLFVGSPYISAAEGDSHVAAIWAVNDGEKIEKDDLDNPLKNGNSVWDGEKVKIFGGRNEIVAFQLIIQAAESGINQLLVSLPELKQRDGDAKISYNPPAKDPTDYVDRDIQIFSINYMYVDKTTNASWIFTPNSPRTPKDTTGWKPVQLVPENAKAGKGGFPLTVEPNMNQGIWFDIYTCKSLPAGFYDGTITVTADGEDFEIPVELELFEFELPDENSMNAILYFDPNQTVRYQGAPLFDEYQRLAHRNRVEFVVPYDEISAEADLDFLKGDRFTTAYGYAGPGMNVGPVVVPRSMYSPPGMFLFREHAQYYANIWMEFLKENLPGRQTFLYMWDEPGQGQYADIRRIADYIHSIENGDGKDLPILVTSGYNYNLDNGGGVSNAIDIWFTNANRYSSSQAEIERSHGDDMWYYNGRRPNSGSVTIDSPATDCRVIPWICYKKEIKTWFKWFVNHWYHNSQAHSSHNRLQNVWVNPITFNEGGNSSFANGDGVLVYPGQDLAYPENDRDIPGPISSIQLANLRRGMQDHLYLTMAKEAGLDQLVEDALEAIVPRVLDEVGNNESVTFPEDGDTYEEWRYKLAKELHNNASTPPGDRYEILERVEVDPPAPYPIPEGAWISFPYPNNGDESTGVYKFDKEYTGKVKIEFDITPTKRADDMVIGFVDSSVNIGNFSPMAFKMRMHQGVFDATNGGGYDVAGPVAVIDGVTYHVKIYMDIPGKKWDVYVTAPGEAPVAIAKDFAKSTKPDATLNNINRISLVSETQFEVAGNPYANAYFIENFTIMEYSEDIAPPVASLEPGTYTGTQTVELTSATEGAEIYYTTDGSEPTTSSNKYTDPLTIASSTTIKAIAVLDGVVSDVAEFVYVISDPFDINVLFKVGGTPATELKAGQLLDATATITNNLSESKQALLIVALYDKDEALINVSYLSKEVLSGQTETIHAGFKLPADVEDKDYKVAAFVWDGVDIMSSKGIPLSRVNMIP